jgi:glycine oxidase
VIGTSISYQLAKAGRRVTLFERNSIGSGATGASAGMIMPARDPAAPASFAALTGQSARLFPALAAELQERTGTDIAYRRAGVLEVAFDDAEAEMLRRQRGWEIDRGGAVAWLDSNDVREIEPAVNTAVRAAIYHADDHQLMPLTFAQALGRAAADLGAVVSEGVAVDALQIEADRVAGVVVGGVLHRAEEVVIATGSWSAAWSAQAGIAIPVRPVRGQIVALRTPGTALRTVLEGAGGYVVAKPDGRVLAGTTVEEAGFDARPTAGAIATLLQRAARLSPRLSEATVVSSWAGLRPATADGLPIIGRVSMRAGLTLATGHFRNGILLAPVTGELITDLILRRKPRFDIEAFDPNRFESRAA